MEVHEAWNRGVIMVRQIDDSDVLDDLKVILADDPILGDMPGSHVIVEELVSWLRQHAAEVAAIFSTYPPIDVNNLLVEIDDRLSALSEYSEDGAFYSTEYAAARDALKSLRDWIVGNAY